MCAHRAEGDLHQRQTHRGPWRGPRAGSRLKSLHPQILAIAPCRSAMSQLASQSKLPFGKGGDGAYGGRSGWARDPWPEYQCVRPLLSMRRARGPPARVRVTDELRVRREPRAPSHPAVICGCFQASDSDELRMLTGRSRLPVPRMVFSSPGRSPATVAPGSPGEPEAARRGVPAPGPAVRPWLAARPRRGGAGRPTRCERSASAGHPRTRPSAPRSPARGRRDPPATGHRPPPGTAVLSSPAPPRPIRVKRNAAGSRPPFRSRARRAGRRICAAALTGVRPYGPAR